MKASAQITTYLLCVTLPWSRLLVIVEATGCPHGVLMTQKTLRITRMSWRRRPRRDDEVDGVDYVFVSRQVFSSWVAQGAMLEHAIVYGDYKVCALVGRRHLGLPYLMSVNGGRFEKSRRAVESVGNNLHSLTFHSSLGSLERIHNAAIMRTQLRPWTRMQTH